MAIEPTNDSPEQLRMETDLLVRLMQEDSKEGWQFTTCIDDVPEEVGHYGLSDGLHGRGGGVSRNMRQSIKQSSWFSQLRRPIFEWLPDTDGSAALWLDHKIRCPRCKAIVDFNDEDG